MPQLTPQNIPLIDRANSDALSMIRRNSSQTVASSFQLQSRDQFGGQVYTRSNTTLDDLSTPVGYNAIASGNRSTAVGAFAYAREDSAVAIGVYALAMGKSSLAIGDQARASGARSIAIGTSGDASGTNSLAVGIGARASGDNATAVGNTNIVSADNSTSVGQGSTISGARSSSVGQGNTISHTDVVAVGNSIISTANGQVILGSATTTFNKVWFGRGVTHTGAAASIEVHATDGTGTNVAGDHLVLVPGLSTGNGVGGNLDVYRSDQDGASGSTVNTAKLAFRVTTRGDVYYTGNGSLPTFSSGFDDIGLLRIGPSRSKANSGVLFNTMTDGNGHIGEVAVITDGAGPWFAIASLKQGSAGNIPIVMFAGTPGGGGAADGQMAIGNGVWVGDETAQSYQGQGTINVSAGLYLNGSAYTNPDYVFEKAFTGKVERFKDRKGAAGYRKFRSLDEIKTYAQEHLHLPQLNDIGLRDAEKGDDIFARADGALLLIEEAYLHLFEMNDRIKALEGA